MKVRVNCPVAGCGTQVDVKYLPTHLEKMHELDGEVVLKLHPTAAYQHIPADQEPEEAEPEKEAEQEQEPEPEKEPEPGEE